MISTEDLRKAYMIGRTSGNSLTAELLQQLEWSNEHIVKIVNALVDKRLCVYIRQTASSQVCVKVRDEETARNVRTLSTDEYAVYCAIEAAGNLGAWTYDICKTSGLPSHVIQAAVKSLCDVRKLIKPLKSIRQRNRKIYILAELEPAKEVVGGTFYHNAELDETLVQNLRSQISFLLKSNHVAPFSDISKYVQGLTHQTGINDDDLKLILKTLVLEQEVSLHEQNGEIQYTWNAWPQLSSVADAYPCASCPVRDECIPHEKCQISPHNCRYFDRWLGYET